MKRAIFWDFDGTITYSLSLWTTSAFRAARRHAAQYAITLEDIRPHLAGGFPWHEWDSDLLLKNDGWWEHMFQKFSRMFQSFGMDGASAGLAGREIREIVLDPSSYEVYADAAATLEACAAAGYRNYILSNNYPELESVIDKLGLSKRFDGYIVSGVTGYNKPRPELFECALKLAGHPDLAFMVGDNPQADIEGGLAAGMRTVLVHNRADCRADHSIDTLSELVGIIKGAK